MQCSFCTNEVPKLNGKYIRTSTNRCAQCSAFVCNNHQECERLPNAMLCPGCSKTHRLEGSLGSGYTIALKEAVSAQAGNPYGREEVTS